MKAKDIHGMTNDELAAKLADLKEELFNLHFRHATGQLENPNVIATTRKDIARIKTEIRAREIKASV
ncbi:MAG: 50S ribosomal protein L29 [Clostridia bacterium]|jgi:large subunit ribosomal protein L29|nr:50S ribosomal protein L29 [Clostridia bacterium]